jgi:putative tryptophan/tyrosine transport system substrate-binding protein
MRRRDLILGLAGALAAPCAARAQGKLPVIGYLSIGSSSVTGPAIAAFRQGLSDVGRVDAQSLVIESRYAQGRYDRLSALVAELVDHNVDVILATGGSVTALAAKRAISTIPIVFIVGDDPVAAGLVASFARPGGNITGVSFLTGELMPKRLELLLAMVPEARVVAFLANPSTPSSEQSRRIVDQMQQAARAKGVAFHVVKASTESEIDAAYVALGELHAEGLVVASDAFFSSRREQLVALASRYAIPAIYEWADIAEIGGLMSYGASITGVYRLAGNYCGKILGGTKPADLPVEQPTKFDLVINLKTAKALGLTVPQVLLAQAEEVIE